MSTRKAPPARDQVRAIKLSKQPRNQVRIGGGQWRGRKLDFPDVIGLRPTPDRVRETLFNWLVPVLPGCHCLDLFAGSGALGFEAASRGAAEVVLVERDTRAIDALRDHQQRLGATQIRIVQADAVQFLRGTARPFDLVLLDPPFGLGLLEAALPMLDQGWLSASAWIYLEAERDMAGDTLSALLPEGFELFRSKAAGQVGYHLARRR